MVIATKTGRSRLTTTRFPGRSSSTKLHRVLAARDQRTVFFDAEDDADFGNAVEILDLARAGGASTIAAPTDPIASGR